MACKVQNAKCLWKRVTRLGNCQATITQTGNCPRVAVHIITDTVTCLGNCWLNFKFTVTYSGNHVRATQMGNVPDCLWVECLDML